LGLALTMALFVAPPQAFADHHGRGHDREQSYNRGGRNHGGKKDRDDRYGKRHDRDHKKHYDNDRRDHKYHDRNRHDRKRHDRYNRPHSSKRPGGFRQAPPPPPRPVGNYRGPRPGYGYVHHPSLKRMIRHAVRNGRYMNVWMVEPNVYAVRFLRNGYYYLQYLYPLSGTYGNPFRIVMDAPDEWYAYGNSAQRYYDDGSSLRISLNGSPLSPWTLIPSIELNLDL